MIFISCITGLCQIHADLANYLFICIDVHLSARRGQLGSVLILNIEQSLLFENLPKMIQVNNQV